MKPNEITASRLKQLRESRELSQEKFGQEFAEFTNRKNGSYSVMTISCWETGRKLPPADTVMSLAQFYGCTSDYILGLSNDPQLMRIDDNIQSMYQKIKIPVNDLQKFDKEAVYVQFPNGTMKNGMGLIDWAKKQIVMIDYKVQIDKRCQYYRVIPPEEITIRDRVSRLLTYKEMMASDRVYIQSLSPDPYIQGMVSGWYHHDITKKFLINDEGRTLSYDGLGTAYSALELNDPTKKVVKKATPAPAKASAKPRKKTTK